MAMGAAMTDAQELLTQAGIHLSSYAAGKHTSICPRCSAERKAHHQKHKCLSIKIDEQGATWHCNHCEWSGPEKGAGQGNGQDRSFAATYDYYDQGGVLRFQKVRNPSGSKTRFFMRRPDGNGRWIINTKGIDTNILYRLPDVNEAIALHRSILVAEGEKDVDHLWRIGIPATCNAHGAADPSQQPKWKAAHSEQLRGADIVVIPDHDEPGYAHADAACRLSIGIAKRVRRLDLAKHWPECPPGGDISDWLAAGHSREELDVLIEQTQDYSDQDQQRHIAARSYIWRDPAHIPPREWLFGRHYVRKAIGATIGGGGRAKTTLGLTEAVSMTCGRNLLTGERITPLRSWYLNGEEDQDELDRRVSALCQHYNITKDDCGGRLFVQSIRDEPMRFATLAKNNVPTLDRELLKQFEAEITANHIDVFMLDPLISFHSVVESANEHMDLLLKEGLGSIASRTHCAGEIFHHPGKPKPGQAETVVEDARGASAIVWAVRSARVLNFMTPAEATKLGLIEDERRLHIRVSNGKANMGPLGKATWFKLEVENLANGDEIACGSPWKPPDPFAGVSTADMHKCRTLAQTGAFRADSRSSDWIGYAVAEVLNINVVPGADNKPEDLARIKQILKIWFKNKVLKTEHREDEHRHKKQFVVPGPWSNSETSDPDLEDMILQ
jgi:hypothetical protein